MSFPLKNTRILSLALNLPGPAALMRCVSLGAECVKIEPLLGDPMHAYSSAIYDELHGGVRVLQADIKTPEGQKSLALELAKADVLLTSFRPAALARLGLDWETLHVRYPKLSQVAIYGDTDPELADVAGHDLTYLAAHGLVTGGDLPATLFADMSGSLMAVEAVFSAVMTQLQTGESTFTTVGLNQAAEYLALPRSWGLTKPDGMVGGAHAGYQIYLCKDGRAAVAALEPQFAKDLLIAAGLRPIADVASKAMMHPETKRLLALWFAKQTCAVLDKLAEEADLPIHTLPAPKVAKTVAKTKIKANYIHN